MIKWLKKKFTKIKYVYPEPSEIGYPIEPGATFVSQSFSIYNQGNKRLYVLGKGNVFWLRESKET